MCFSERISLGIGLSGIVTAALIYARMKYATITI